VNRHILACLLSRVAADRPPLYECVYVSVCECVSVCMSGLYSANLVNRN